MMEKIVRETKYLNEDSDFIKFMSVEEEDRLYINTWKAQGKREGKALGIEQKTKEIVKSMLEKNYEIKEICNITGMSIEEIEKIKNNE